MFEIKIIPRLLNFVKRIFIGPALRFIFIILKLSSRFRVLNTNAAAIGHLCVDIDCFLKEKELRKYTFRGILLAPRSRVSNRVLSKLWAQHSGIILIENPAACFVLDYLRIYNETCFDCTKYCATDGQPAEVFAIYNEYQKSNPMISWEPGLHAAASLLFEKVFPSVDIKKVVALHSRDSLFDKSIQNPNYFTQKYRNSDIGSFSEILKFLAECGYTVIRIGEYEQDKSNSNIGYLELPELNQYESELLNVYIPSICALFLGSASGAQQLAAIWNRPVFLINILPYALLRPHYAQSMAIPKLISSNDCIIGASEIFERDYHWYRDDRLYQDSGLDIINNAPSDCLDDFKEFFKCFVEQNLVLRKELMNSPQQTKYEEICPSNSYDYNARSLIPRHFFEKYKS